MSLADLRERVLEHALEELHEPARDRDVATAVLEAFERGERRSTTGLQDPLDAPVAPPVPEAPPTFRRTFGILAAVAAGLALLFLVSRRPWGSREPRVSQGPVHIGPDGPHPTPRPPEALVAREALELGGSGGPRLRVAAGGLLVRPGAGISGAPASPWELVDGTFELEAGSQPVRVGTPAGLLSLAAGTRASVRVENRRRPGAEDAELSLRWAEGPSQALPRARVELSVLAGSVAVADPFEAERLLAEAGDGEELALATVEGQVGVEDPEQRRRLRFALDALLEEPPSYVKTTQWEIASLLAESPWYELLLEDRLRGLLDAPETPGTRRAIDLLARVPSELMTTLASELWLRVPELFGERNVLLLAERGSFEFEREVEAMASERISAPAEEPSEDDLLLVASRALRDDPEAVAYLADLPATVLPAAGPGGLAAAAALRRAGVREPWEAVRLTVRQELAEALRVGDLPVAARWLESYELFHDALRDGFRPSLAEAIRRSEGPGRSIGTADEILDRAVRLGLL